MRQCNAHQCPVDGEYSDFGEWSECSAECDGGNQTRVRQCDSPAPEHGGADCEGEDSEMRQCNNQDCKVCEDSNSSYNKCGSNCTKTCEESCEKPMVVHDNKFLSFDFGEEGECEKRCECNEGYVSHMGECIDEDFCPVDGEYSDFGEWSECSAECDGGIQNRVRQCDSPAPEHGGADCEGRPSEMRQCNAHQCPVDGEYSDFGEWSECSAECDGGNQTRTRQCDNPAPEHGGADCEGEDSEMQGCNNHECAVAVDGQYGEFGDWTECEGCGQNQSRMRECNNPAPAHGGSDCSDRPAEEIRSCPCEKLTTVFEMKEHENIAASGTASQSNSAYKGYAELAIDGDTNGDFEAGSVTHTRTPGADVFWMLTFDSPQYIKNVVLWGRSDCCQKRIDGAKFSIDNVEMGELLSEQMREDKEEFEINSFAREIMIKGPRGKLSLAEVEVFGVRSDFKNIVGEGELGMMGVPGRVTYMIKWDSPRQINSIVINFNESPSMDQFGNIRVYVGETEVGQVDVKVGKMAYIFGGLEGLYTQVYFVGVDEMDYVEDVEIYGV